MCVKNSQREEKDNSLWRYILKISTAELGTYSGNQRVRGDAKGEEKQCDSIEEEPIPLFKSCYK